jgi:hypothetical protein
LELISTRLFSSYFLISVKPLNFFQIIKNKKIHDELRHVTMIIVAGNPKTKVTGAKKDDIKLIPAPNNKYTFLTLQMFCFSFFI